MHFNTKGIGYYHNYILGNNDKYFNYDKLVNISIDENLKIKRGMVYNIETIMLILNTDVNEITPNYNQEILINFSNFSNFKYLKDLAKNLIISKEFIHDAEYSSSGNEVIFRRNILNEKNEMFRLLKNENISDSEIMNFVLLHEIGHGIHDTLNKNGIPFVNIQSEGADFINSFTKSMDENWFTLEHDIIRKVNNTISEGFADLYALIFINKFYSVSQSEKIAKAVLKSRIFLRDINNETYNTVGSIEKFIEMNKKDPYKFKKIKKYKDIENFIFKTTLEENFIMLGKEINFNINVYEEDKHKGINFFAGVIYESNKLNLKNIEPNTIHTLDYISENMNLPESFTDSINKCLSNGLYYNMENHFKYGRNEYIRISTPLLKIENENSVVDKIKNFIFEREKSENKIDNPKEKKQKRIIK